MYGIKGEGRQNWGSGRSGEMRQGQSTREISPRPERLQNQRGKRASLRVRPSQGPGCFTPQRLS